ncbi:membrane protein insertion efficiency factor YidD [Ectothiorhodospiraceae bacterium WFHF3C12]|nr:membrane protein insertion efficiency factor YidD [Ectothiorhodospiraceae bacterium WFHF3C12]
MNRLVLWTIHRYRATGGGKRWFGLDCNFEPSCSLYAMQAMERFGLSRGARLAWQRIRRCRARDSICKCHEPCPESFRDA